jgi:FkbM family methyltransferase
MTSFVSYAQNFEDVMLWRALGHVEAGFYIDVGAHHPVVDSVSKAFYERGWRGIHIEPTPYYADLLTRDRTDECVIRAAIGNHAGTMAFYEMHGLSTGNADIAQGHREQGIESREVVVPCIRLDDVIARAEGREIHWLKIDVEGMEQQVLEGWSSPIFPWVVVIESTLPNSSKENWGAWEPLLLEKGYKFVYFDGLNRFYISAQHPELEPTFRSSPNVFDNFALHGDSSAPFCSYLNDQHKQQEQELEQRAASLGDELLALQKNVSLRKEEQDRLLQEHQQLERSLAAELDDVKGEALVAKEAMFSEFSTRERDLLIQLEAGRADQVRLLQVSSATESKLFERIVEAKDQNNHEKQALLLKIVELEQTYQNTLVQVSSDAAERQLLLVSQLNESRDTADQERASLLRELVAQEAVHSSVLEELRGELEERVAALTSAHEARERELHERIARAREDIHARTLAMLRDAVGEQAQRLAREHADRELGLRADIDLLRAERATLTKRWEYWERAATQRHNEHEQTKREQFNNLLSRENSHAQVIKELHGTINLQFNELTSAHVERERELLECIDALRTERTSLTTRWEHWESQANLQRNAHEETKRVQFADLLTREDSHARVVSEFKRVKDEQIHQLTLVHNEREEALRAQIEQVLREQAVRSAHRESDWNQQLQAHEETKQALVTDLHQLEQQLQESRIAKAQLNEELRILSAVAVKTAWMENTLSWKITTPFRALAKVMGIGSVAGAELAPLPHDAVSETGVDATQHVASPTPKPNAEIPGYQKGIADQLLSAASAYGESEFSQPLSPKNSMKTIKHIDRVLELKGSIFVDAAYKALLNRAPDSKGMAYYLGRLRLGRGKAAVISQLARSSEAKAIRAQIPGLDDLVASQMRARHWFWRWFSDRSTIATQLNRIEFELEEMELRSDARLRAFERRVETIVDRLHSKIVKLRIAPVMMEESGGGESAIERALREPIIDGLALPVTGSPSEIISALERQVVESLEATSFER